jgi:serine/threonine protein phosphatase PrpC
LENEWIEITKVAFHNGYPRSAYVGSCALVTIVYNNKIYVANAGDSKACLMRKNGEEGY